MTDEQLSALLRLKRYEQPAPEYFDRLLDEVRRAQRTELLRRPLWQIMAERVQTFFSEHSMGSSSYAGAMAAALVAGLLAIGVILPGDVESQGKRNIAAAGAPKVPAPSPMLSLEASSSATELGADSFRTVSARAGAGHQPRYVIDARPVSYEASFEF